MSYAVVHKPRWRIEYKPDLQKVAIEITDAQPDDPLDTEPILKALLPRWDALRLGTALLQAVSDMDRSTE